MKSDGCYKFRRTIQALRGLYDTHDVPVPHVIFVRQREEAEEVAGYFAGEDGDGSGRWCWVHGGMPDAERAERARLMREGGLDVVVCTDVWATGVDIPNIAAVVMACGGSAPIGLKQRSGRGTRLFGAKEEFLIFDVALSVDDDHQEKRVRGYLDGGYEVEGAADVIEAGELVGEDEDLAALFSPRARARRERPPSGIIEPPPSQWELLQRVQSDTSWRLLPLLILVALLAICGRGP